MIDWRPQGCACRVAVLVLAALLVAGCGRSATSSQPEPGFWRHSADEIVQALRAAELDVEQVTARPVATPTPRPEVRVPLGRPPKPVIEPMTEVEAVTFVIPSQGGKAGHLLTFDSSERLRAKQIWFARFPDQYPYVYVHENVLLWLDASLPPVVAARYQAALQALP